MRLFRLLFLGGGGAFGQGGAAAGGGAQQRASPPNRPPRATQEQVAEALQKLPAEQYISKEELDGMSVHELRERARTAGVDLGRAIVERKDLVQRIMQV